MNAPTLVFDLGGVVVPWVGFEAIAEMTGLSREIIDHRFGSDPALSQFETGRSGVDAFCHALPDAYDLDLDPAEVPALWNSWVRPPFPGVVEAIRALNATHRTACLSNTNALHWEHLQTFFSTDALFDVPMASHILQRAKPDPAIYAAAQKQLGAEPADIWFFEDTARNLDAARDAGWTVYPVDRAHGVLPVLRELGLAG